MLQSSIFENLAIYSVLIVCLFTPSQREGIERSEGVKNMKYVTYGGLEVAVPFHAAMRGMEMQFQDMEHSSH